MPQLTEVHILEHRNNLDENTIAYIASSREKAEAYMRSQPDFDDVPTKKCLWWWAIYKESIDAETSECDLAYYSWDGIQIDDVNVYVEGLP